MAVNLEDLRKENEVLDIFCNLVSIPSPSLKEDKVIEWILDFCKKNGIDGKKDNHSRKREQKKNSHIKWAQFQKETLSLQRRRTKRVCHVSL